MTCIGCVRTYCYCWFRDHFQRVDEDLKGTGSWNLETKIDSLKGLWNVHKSVRVDWAWTSTFLARLQAILQGDKDLFQREILPKERRREIYWSIHKSCSNVESILRRNENASIFIFLNRSICWIRTSLVSSFIPKFNSFTVHLTWGSRKEVEGNARKMKKSCWNLNCLV